MKATAYRPLRRATQIGFILFIFLMPVLNILRFDVDTHTLYIFGIEWSFDIGKEIFATHGIAAAGTVAKVIVLKGILPWLVVLSVFPLLGYLFGRFFCGWLCPEGALFEFADFLTLKIVGRKSLFGVKPNDPPAIPDHRPYYILLAILYFAAILPLSGIALTGFFIAPSRIWHEVLSLHLSWGVTAGITGVSIYLIATSIIVRHAFCKYVCAAGLMQMLFGYIAPKSLKLTFDRANISRCTSCRKCETVCFMGVKPRSIKTDINCVNCAECIVACEEELGEGRTLFDLTKKKIM